MKEIPLPPPTHYSIDDVSTSATPGGKQALSGAAMPEWAGLDTCLVMPQTQACINPLQ